MVPLIVGSTKPENVWEGFFTRSEARRNVGFLKKRVLGVLQAWFLALSHYD